MFVRLVRDWRGYRLGRLLDVSGGVAGVLIRRGIAAEAGNASAAPLVEPPPLPTKPANPSQATKPEAKKPAAKAPAKKPTAKAKGSKR